MARSDMAAAVAFAGYALLLVAWLAATPPFHAPDEVAHYIRAHGLGQGDVVGDVPVRVDPSAEVRADPGSLARYDWTYETTTLVVVSGALDPFGRDCARDAEVAAACVDDPIAPGPGGGRPTNTGTTTPLAVGLPSLSMRAGGDTGAALTLARIGQLSSTLLALGVVLVALRPAAGAATAGLALAITPMVLYVGVVLNPSGPEVWGTLACLGASWRMLAVDQVGRRWVWIAATTALLLPLTRQPGAVWAVIALASAIGLQAGDGLWALLWDRHRTLALWVAAWVSGCLAATAWNGVVAVETPLALAAVDGALVRLWQDLPNLLRHVIGEFNVFEAQLPSVVFRTWLGLITVVVVVAVLRAPRRWWVPMLPVAGTAAFTLGFWLLSYRFTGFGLQGRHMLPAFVLIPLVACLALPLGRRTVIGIGGVVAVLHVVAWGAAARRFAVGTDGAVLFWRGAEWDPAGGWLPWIIVVVVGAGLLAGTAWLTVPRSASSKAGGAVTARSRAA